MSPMTNVYILFAFVFLLEPSIIIQSSATQEEWQSNSNYTVPEFILKWGLIPLLQTWGYQSPKDIKFMYEDFTTIAEKGAKIIEVLPKMSKWSIAAHGFVTLSFGAAFATWHISKVSSKVKAELWKELHEQSFKELQEKIKTLRKTVDDMERIASNSNGLIQMQNELSRMEELFEEMLRQFKNVNAHIDNVFITLTTKINICMNMEIKKHTEAGRIAGALTAAGAGMLLIIAPPAGFAAFLSGTMIAGTAAVWNGYQSLELTTERELMLVAVQELHGKLKIELNTLYDCVENLKKKLKVTDNTKDVAVLNMITTEDRDIWYDIASKVVEVANKTRSDLPEKYTIFVTAMHYQHYGDHLEFK